MRMNCGALRRFGLGLLGSLGATTAGATTPPPPCRALVNVRVAGQVASDGYAVHEIRFGHGTPWVGTALGLAVAGADGISRLRVLTDGGAFPGQWFTQTRVERLAPKGKAVALRVSGAAVTAAQSAQMMVDVEPMLLPFYETGIFNEIAVLGPYLGVLATTEGFGGGAHGYDSYDWSLWDVGAGAAVNPLSLWATPAAVIAAAQQTAAAAKLDPPPDVNAETLGRAGLRVSEGQLQLVEGLDCCTWVENHNLYDLAQPVPTPPALQAVVPDAQGWYRQGPGPGACRLKRTPNGVEVAGGAGAPTALTLPGAWVGLSWASLSAPAVAPLPADAKAAKAALKALATVDADAVAWALAQRAVTLAPADPGVALEAAWTLFKRGKMDEHQGAAEQLARAAVAGLTSQPKGAAAPSAKTLRQAHYTLGRTLEARGDVAGARAAYTAALAAEHNATVAARLAGLAEAKPAVSPASAAP